MLVFGTRPEAIKMCPLIKEIKRRKDIRDLRMVTIDGEDAKDLEAFHVVPDYDLSIMKDKQTLFDITTNILNRIKSVLEEVRPDIVLVHGDTSTTFVTALACFYLQIPVGHVEAGLRTYNTDRRLVSSASTTLPLLSFQSRTFCARARMRTAFM